MAPERRHPILLAALDAAQTGIVDEIVRLFDMLLPTPTATPVAGKPGKAQLLRRYLSAGTTLMRAHGVPERRRVHGHSSRRGVELGAMTPGPLLVVGRVVSQAAVEDADQPVRKDS